MSSLGSTRRKKRLRQALEQQTEEPPREFDDLFGGNAVTRRGSANGRRIRPELAAARVLARQIGRKQVGEEKKRIAHLICLNLLSVLKHR